MSSSASRPPGASPRKLVLRRKANAPSLPSPRPPDVFDSKVSRLTAGRPTVGSPYSRRAEPSGAVPPPIPPASGLPRDLWPDAAQESPVQTARFTPPPPPPHLHDPSAHLSPPPHLPQTRAGESVLPTVATVAPAGPAGLGGDLAPVAARRAGRSFFPVAAAASVVLVVAAGWLGARLQHAAPAAARAAPAVPPPSAAPVEAPPPQQAAQAPSEPHDTVPTTDIDALPKAQPAKMVPFAGAPRAVHNAEPSAVGAAPPAPKDNLAASPAASASARSAAAASASADAPDPLLDKAPSAPPPVDPLIKAVQQDIVDEQHK